MIKTLVTGALSSDDSIWDNVPTSSDQKSPDEWKRLCFKYKAKILDFGFARALTPGDMEDVTVTKPTRSASPNHHPKKKDAGYHNIQDRRFNKSKNQNKSKKMGGLFSNNSNSNSNNSLSQLLEGSGHSVGSVSHKMKRTMSTLGHRDYAAPEIVNKVRQLSAQDKKKEQQTSGTTKTISSFVADYGLLVDSYSMGHTIRYMMTGVQPGFSVEEAIKKQQRSVKAKKVLSKFGLGKKKDPQNKKKIPRKPRYRSLGDLPGQVFLLISKLTQISPHLRISIRKARRTVPWVSDVMSFQIQRNWYDGASPSSEESENHSPLLLLDHISEEQLHSLQQTRYLQMATTESGPMVLTRGVTTKTVTTIDSNHDFPLDDSDGCNRNMDSNKNKNNSNNNVIAVMDRNDPIGLFVQDDMITY